MAIPNNHTWPLSWREKLDMMEIGDDLDVDEKFVKSVRYIASKNFNSPKANSKKRFTVKKVPGSNPPRWKVWRKNDVQT